MSKGERLDYGASLGPEDNLENPEEMRERIAPFREGSEPEHERLRTLAEEINRQLSPRIEQTTLLLYELDPERLQAQWYVTQDDFARVRAVFPGEPADLRQALRLCRLDSEGRAEVVERAVTAASCETLQGYQRFAPDQVDAEYECELGLESAGGGWVMLVRSNRVRLAGRDIPPGGISAELGRRQAPAQRGERTEGGDGFGEPRVEPALAAEGEVLYPVFPHPGSVDRDSGIRPALEDRARAEGSNKGSARSLPERAEEGRVRGQGGGADAVSGSDWSEMPPPLLPSTWNQSPADGSIPRYDPRAALSSSALRGSVRMQAELDVDAELVVRGQAAPDTLIDLFGLSVRTRKDGRFSISRPVSDPLVLSLALGGQLEANSDDSKSE